MLPCSIEISAFVKLAAVFVIFAANATDSPTIEVVVPVAICAVPGTTWVEVAVAIIAAAVPADQGFDKNGVQILICKVPAFTRVVPAAVTALPIFDVMFPAVATSPAIWLVVSAIL